MNFVQFGVRKVPHKLEADRLVFKVLIKFGRIMKLNFAAGLHCYLFSSNSDVSACITVTFFIASLQPI